MLIVIIKWEIDIPLEIRKVDQLIGFYVKSQTQVKRVFLNPHIVCD